VSAEGKSGRGWLHAFQASRFVVVGVLNTLVDYVLFVGITKVFHLPLGSVWIAKVISGTVAMTVSFFLNQRWVFAARGHSPVHHQAARFFAVTAVAVYGVGVPVTQLFAHTYQARDYAPRLAARLDRPLVTDCIAVKRSDRDLVFTRPMFQGKVSADVVLEGPPPHLVTFQAGAFRAEAPGPDASPAPIRSIAASIPPGAVRQRPEPPFREARQAVDLTQAERIVSVGRGIKEEQHVALARRLAEALGAELAASRPICDAGWLPMDRQVGSSGQTVAPKLYVALGISGAIQHIVGMKGSRTIVAINKDADAPIFEVADYGIVGDLFEIVPAMIEALK